jgi:transposase
VNEHMSDSRSFEVLTANPVRLSSSPARSYRSWSDEEKARIVGETLVAGANVSAIARSHGLDPSQLFAWRRKAMASGVVAPLIGAPSRPVKFARFEAMRSDMVEIVIGDVVVRAGSDVEADRLADVIRAVRKA